MNKDDRTSPQINQHMLFASKINSGFYLSELGVLFEIVMNRLYRRVTYTIACA